MINNDGHAEPFEEDFIIQNTDPNLTPIKQSPLMAHLKNLSPLMPHLKISPLMLDFTMEDGK